jgi:hypothetical protein
MASITALTTANGKLPRTKGAFNMLAEQDRSYLERRYHDSLLRAETATDPGIAKIHREFALQHERRLNDQGPSLRVVQG